MSYILALDQGTTSSRSVLIDKSGKIVCIAQYEFEQIFPEPGWVEHDPIEIWATQLKTMKEVVEKAGISVKDINAIGITNQRETTVIWDRETGKPVYNAIVWQDRRTADFCQKLKADGYEGYIQQRTGLVVDPYFSGSKINWILDNVEGARAQAEAGKLCFGTIDTWLLWHLTGGAVHLTDVSNASRTMLCDIHTGVWDEKLMKILNVPASLLPKICSSSEVYGHTEVLEEGYKIPIAGIAGDQHAALFGQLCTKPGMVKNTYGTGCFMLMNTGKELVPSNHNLLTTIAWKINGEISYAIEGSVFIGGAVVQWLRDGLKIIKNASEVEALAKTVDNTDGVFVVPSFAGLGAPHWKADARGVITGLTRGSNTAHIARAALESIAYQTMDVLHAMEADSGIKISELRVDGGATQNDLLMQFQSDMLQAAVVRPVVTESTALGAAYLAGLATGFWSGIDELQQQWQIEKNFEPQMDTEKVEEKRAGWHLAVQAALAS